MYLLSILATLIGAGGFAATFLGFINVLPLKTWGIACVVSAVVAVLTGRPND